MHINSSSRSCGTTRALSTIPLLAFISLFLFVYSLEYSHASELPLALTEQLSCGHDFRLFKAKEAGAVTETLAVYFPIRGGFVVSEENFESLQTISAKTKDFPDQQYLALPEPAYPGLMHKFLDSDEFQRLLPFLTRNCKVAGSYSSIVYPLFQDGDLWSFLNSLQKTQALVEKVTILSISRSILKGLKLLHEKAHVIHGSLNTRNIWLRRINDNYSASIANMAINLQIGVPTKRQNVDQGYTPNQHNSMLVPAASIDVFSFGSVLYQLTLGELVHAKSLEKAQAELQSCPETKFQDNPWQFIISKCWSKREDERPTIDTILEWLDEFELLSSAAPTIFKLTRKLSGNIGKVRLYQAEEMSDISMTLLVKVADDYNPDNLANNRAALEAELRNLHHISNKLVTSSELQSFLLYAPGYPNLNKIELPSGELGRYALVLPFPHRPSLRSFLLQNKNMKQVKGAQILSVARSVLLNLKVLHEKVGMVHGNLKPEHILLHPDSQTSIMDFGFATSIGQERDLFSESNGYRPPEARSRTYLKMETSFDVFAFGSLLRELIYIMEESFSISTDKLWSIVGSCRKSKAADRPSIDQILEMLQAYEDKQKRKYEDQQWRKCEVKHISVGGRMRQFFGALCQ